MTNQDTKSAMDAERRPLFERLSLGLKEAIAYAKGEMTLRTVEVPDKPPEIDGSSIASTKPKPPRD